MVFNTQDLSEFVPPEVWEAIKGEDRAHIGPNLSINVCACTRHEIQKLALNLPDQNEQIANYPELFDERGQVLSEEVIHNSFDVTDEEVFETDAEVFETYEDPVKKIIMETFITEGEQGLEDLVVRHPEKFTHNVSFAPIKKKRRSERSE